MYVYTQYIYLEYIVRYLLFIVSYVRKNIWSNLTLK